MSDSGHRLSAAGALVPQGPEYLEPRPPLPSALEKPWTLTYLFSVIDSALQVIYPKAISTQGSGYSLTRVSAS